MDYEAAALSRPKVTRRRKPLLTAISRATDALLDSLPCDVPARRGELRQWTDEVISDARRFSGARLQSGLFGAKPLTKAQAEQALRDALTGGLANVG